MANERKRLVLQEALDDNLTQEARQKLFQEMDQNADVAAEYSRLRQVEAILRNAPLERAPKRLALAIMARLAEGVRAQPEISGLALALGLTLVTLVTLPLLIAAGWLALQALASVALLSELLKQVVSLVGTLLSVLQGFVNQAQTLIESYPEAPALIMGLMAVSVFGLMGYAYYTRRSTDQGGRA
jgi:hypothetical protein